MLNKLVIASFRKLFRVGGNSPALPPEGFASGKKGRRPALVLSG